MVRWGWFHSANSEFLSDGVVNDLHRITDGATGYVRPTQYVGGSSCAKRDE